MIEEAENEEENLTIDAGKQNPLQIGSLSDHESDDDILADED